VRGDKTGDHVAYLQASRDQLRFSGPTLSDDGATVTGGINLLDAPDRAAAEAWKNAEPYTAAGAFADVTLTRWSSSMELRQADYPRTEGWQQFAIFDPNISVITADLNAMIADIKLLFGLATNALVF